MSDCLWCYEARESVAGFSGLLATFCEPCADAIAEQRGWDLLARRPELRRHANPPADATERRRRASDGECSV